MFLSPPHAWPAEPFHPRPPRPDAPRAGTLRARAPREHFRDWLSLGEPNGMNNAEMGLRWLSPIRLKISIPFMHTTVRVHFYLIV